MEDMPGSTGSAPDMQALKDELVSLRSVLDEVGACVFTKDLEGRYTYANQKVVQTFGQPLDVIIGSDDRQLWGAKTGEAIIESDRQIMATGETRAMEESNRVSRDELRTYWVIKKPLRNTRGDIIGMCGVSSDITERKQLEQQLREQKWILERQARTDSLTGAANRRRFYGRARQCFEYSQASGRAMSLVAFDLDHFKRINDRYGHPVGDEVLRTIVESCQDTLRDGDLLARTGGEEFAVLMPDTIIENAREAAERMRELIDKARVSNSYPILRVTASFGVVQMTKDDSSFDALFTRADNALYEAKERGRNCVV